MKCYRSVVLGVANPSSGALAAMLEQCICFIFDAFLSYII